MNSIWDGNSPYWRLGPWNGHVFIGVPSTYYFVLVDVFRLENDHQDTLSLCFSTSKLRVNHSFFTDPITWLE